MVRKTSTQRRVEAIKLEQGCVDCGYRRCSSALHFDHRSGTLKLGNISAMAGKGRPWEVIQEEIDKCDIRCANCHAEKTARDRSAGYNGEDVRRRLEGLARFAGGK